VQEALGQRKILSLLFIFGQENLNSIYPHETAKSQMIFGCIIFHNDPHRGRYVDTNCRSMNRMFFCSIWH